MLLLKCHGFCSKGAQEEDARQIFWQLIPALDYCHKMVGCWEFLWSASHPTLGCPTTHLQDLLQSISIGGRFHGSNRRACCAGRVAPIPYRA